MALDTSSDIAALSSAAGSGGRCVLRLSGPGSLGIADTLFTPDTKTELKYSKGFRRISGLAATGAVVLPACAYVFRAPRSYTRQNLCELHLPGSTAVGRIFLEAALAAGARQAAAGEFTLRALLSGRLDLSRAEAVADIIAADSDAELRSAQANAAGRLSGLCRRWSERLTEVLAEVEAAIDMAEEGLETLTPEAASARLSALADDMAAALDAAAAPGSGEALPLVLLAGEPNAGKSSLANALLGDKRSIVSPRAGATRDAPATRLTLPGGTQTLLADSPGLGADLEGGSVPDRAAQRRARDMLAEAAAVVLVADLSPGRRACLASLRRFLDRYLAVNERDAGDRARRPVLIALNKSDRAGGRTAPLAAEIARRTGIDALVCSALTGDGVAELARAIETRLNDAALADGASLSLHARQACELRSALATVRDGLARLTMLSAVSDAAELLAFDLREALGHLGLIAGHAAGDEVLAVIFSRFCVGK